jgi:hypothetical protein
MDWKKGTPLADNQTGHPIVWHSTLKAMGFGKVHLPALRAGWYEQLWGDAKDTRRIKLWGHADPNAKPQSTSPHFLCSRGGAPLHTDPGFTRYALQVQLHNQGFCVLGLEDAIEDMPLYEPGLVIILDTWSPHAVMRDPRLPLTGANKLLIGFDAAEMPDPRRDLPKLVKHIASLALPKMPVGAYP